MLNPNMISLKLKQGRLNEAFDKIYESFATVGEIRVYWRADFQSGSRVLKNVF